MSTEMVEKRTGELIEVNIPNESAIVSKVKAFMDDKEKKITFNGKRYAEYEDWQYAAGFFGLKVKTLDPQFVEINGSKGFRAKAVVIDKEGGEVGSAEAFCMMDEPNWKNKPIFQLSSMAQTRAGAKALSNIFRPLMRMAGIEGTPSEEMTGQEHPTVRMPQAKAPIEHPDVEKAQRVLGGKITDKQRKMLFAKCRSQGITEEEFKAFLWEKFKLEHTADLGWKDMDTVLAWIDCYAPETETTSN